MLIDSEYYKFVFVISAELYQSCRELSIPFSLLTLYSFSSPLLPPFTPLSHAPSLSPPLSFSPLLVGEHLRLLKSGTDLIKVKKSKTYARLFRLEEDLLGVAWKSMHKKPNKARSKWPEGVQ